MPTDALEQAKRHLDKSLGEFAGRLEAARAQAAAQIAIAEQVKRIADAVQSIGIVLTNASGSDGVIKVEAWTYDARRELG